MPAPLPGDVELSVGLKQWGAETEASSAITNEQLLATMLELAKPLPTARSKEEMCETLAAAAQVHELPVGFFVRLINQESGFNPEVVSPAGAQGVAQFMPRVAQEWGLKNPFDPHAALIASARFLRSLYEQFGNWGLAAAAYNGGMGRVQKWIDKRGKLPEETRNYVMRITGLSAEQWADGKPSIAKFSIPERAPCQEIAHLADSPAPRPSAPAPRPVRIQQQYIQFTAGPPSKTGPGGVTVVTVKGGTKLATIKVKRSKAAVAKAKTAAPSSAVAANALAKGKRGKASATRVAGKSSAKSKTKTAKNSKGKDRVRLADARNSRK